MDAIAIVIEDGVLVQHPQARLDSTLIARKRDSQGEAATIVSSSALELFWRITTRVIEYFTRIRSFFIFTPAKEGSIEFKEERGMSENGINVEEGLRPASGACEPELAEIIVSEKETTNHGQDRDADSNATELHHEDCGSKSCTLHMKPEELHQSGISSDDCKPTQSGKTREQEPNSLTSDSAKVVIQLCREDCTETNLQTTVDGQSDASKPTQWLALEGGSIELPNLVTSSKSLNKKFSIQHLNAMVAEQLTKYLQVLERSVAAGKSEHQAAWSHKTTHRRAIILATLVAVAVWARNAKHLHESMPRIKGCAINVHIRSRL